MNKLSPLVIAFLVTTGAFGQESEEVLYKRLSSLGSDVISEHLNGPICSPGPDLAKKQAELAEVISKATPSTGPHILELAVMANSDADVQRLFEGGAPPYSPHGTPLHTAAMFGSPSMLEYLVAAGFELEDNGNASGPALLVAVQAGNFENTRWLIENGANVNATDTSGAPVIRLSVACGNQALVDLLLEAGAVPDGRTREAAQRLGISLQPAN